MTACIDSNRVPSHADYVQCAEEALHCFRTRLADSTNLPYTIRCASPTHDHRIRNDFMQVAQITLVPITQYTHFIYINSVHLVLHTNSHRSLKYHKHCNLSDNTSHCRMHHCTTPSLHIALKLVFHHNATVV